MGKKVFYHLFFFLFTLLPLQGLTAGAQPAAGNDFRIYYITTTRFVDTHSLTQYLRDEYADIVRDDRMDAVFYLPELSQQMTATIVPVSRTSPHREDFDNLLDNISGMAFAHDANPDADIPALIDYFRENDFMDADGRLACRSLRFHYIVNPDTDLEDGFVPKLYFTFGFSDLPEGLFQFRILHQRGDEFRYNENEPFGSWTPYCKNCIVTSYE